MKKCLLLKKIGKKIKNVRLSQGITQVELVIKMEENYGKIDETNISRIESGRTNPTIFTLYRIAEALEVPLEELIKIEA